MLNRNEGFTLIEVLVGINLSLVVVTLLISFYLFSVKFASATAATLNEKQSIFIFLNLFEERIKKSDDYFFVKKNDIETFVFDDRYTFSFDKNHFKINDLFYIENINEYSIKINLINGDNLSFFNGEIFSAPINFRSSESIPASDIKSVEISFSIQQKNYHLFCFNHLKGYKAFKNISN